MITIETSGKYAIGSYSKISTLQDSIFVSKKIAILGLLREI
jgi:hypothetical protein